MSEALHLPNLHGLQANPKLEHSVIMVSAVLGIIGFVMFARSRGAASAGGGAGDIFGPGAGPGTTGTDNSAGLAALSAQTTAAFAALNTQYGTEFTTIGQDLTVLGTNQSALQAAIDALKAAQTGAGGAAGGPSLTLDLSVLDGSSHNAAANAWDNQTHNSGSTDYETSSSKSNSSSGHGGFSFGGFSIGGGGSGSGSSTSASKNYNSWDNSTKDSGANSSAYDTTFSQDIKATATGFSSDQLANLLDVLSVTSRRAQIAAVDPTELHQSYAWAAANPNNPGAHGYAVASPYSIADVHNLGRNDWGATPVANRPVEGQSIWGLKLKANPGIHELTQAEKDSLNNFTAPGAGMGGIH